MQRGDSDTHVRQNEKKLEYILDMLDQLADLADSIKEPQFGGALRSAADMRRVCAPSRRRHYGAQDGRLPN